MTTLCEHCCTPLIPGTEGKVCHTCIQLWLAYQAEKDDDWNGEMD